MAYIRSLFPVLRELKLGAPRAKKLGGTMDKGQREEKDVQKMVRPTRGDSSLDMNVTRADSNKILLFPKYFSHIFVLNHMSIYSLRLTNKLLRVC
jgi:hypothetical protein